MICFRSDGPILRCEGIYYNISRIDKTEALLNNVSFEMRPGEFVLIEGESGVGKTTLMKICAGLLRPLRGEVYWNEYMVFPDPQKDIDRRRGKNIGFIFQRPNLIPHLSAEENISLPAVISGMPKKDIYLTLKEVIEMFQIEKRTWLKQSAGSLSGGEQQRINIARAFICRPKVILGDEILTALDKDLRDQVWPNIKVKCRENSIALVIVTHSQNLSKDRDIDKHFRLRNRKLEKVEILH